MRPHIIVTSATGGGRLLHVRHICVHGRNDSQPYFLKACLDFLPQIETLHVMRVRPVDGILVVERKTCVGSDLVCTTFD